MRSVVGIDAAWTVGQPSGVALAKETGDGWELVTVAASYQQFHARADNTLIAEVRPLGSIPVAGDLLHSCRRLCGGSVDLVAVDMPCHTSRLRGVEQRMTPFHALMEDISAAPIAQAPKDRGA